MYDFSFISFLFFLGTGLNIFSASLLWPRRRMKAAITLFGLMMAFMIWTFCSGMELGATTLSGDVFWSKIAYFGSCTVPVLFFIFSLQFTDHDKFLSTRRTILIWVIPAVSVLLVLTNEYHHLIWTAVLPNPAPGDVHYLYYHGLWFWVLNVYSYVLLVFATLLLVMEAIHQQKVYRRQSHVILIGIPLPWIANLLYISGFSPMQGFDLTPLMFSITGLLYSFGLYRYELLDLVPVARNKIFEDLQDGLIVLDMQERLVDLNPVAAQMLELNASEAIGNPISDLSPVLETFLSSDVSQVEIKLKPESGEWRELRVSPLIDGRGVLSGKLLILRDISSRKKTEEELQSKSRELEKLAEMDTLTRLFNRRYAESVLEFEINKTRDMGVPLSMGEVDLDNFKGVNDRYGHIRGDKVLQQVAEEFTSGTRTLDVIARMGGDEFIFIFRGTQISESIQVIERLRQKVEKHKFPGLKEPLTFSAGVILCRPNETADDAMRRVDKLLYQAKRAGRNRVISEAK
jgi:diguanylate cyclase (GGDEF)-like protein/PAS domain S-box-containing protein